MRVAIYERVSTQEQAMHGLSIEAQDEMLHKWCQENDHVVVGVYRDEGISGKKPIKRRPALVRLLDDVEKDKIDLILFQKLDRWTRNVKQYFIAQDILDAHNVSWKALLEDYETITAAGKFKVNIMLAVAENESDRTSERIKVVLDMKRSKGQMASGRVPFGYIKKNNVISFDPDKHDAVVAFLDEYLLTSSIKKGQDAAAAHGVHMTYKNCDSLLRSPVTYGAYGAPAYLDEKQRKTVEAIRIHTTRLVDADRVYLFSGMIYCDHCKGRAYSKCTAKNGKDYYYYICKRDCPNHAQVNEEIIERVLLDSVAEKLAHYKMVATSVQAVDNNKKIAALKHKQSKLKTLYMNDLITLEEYKADNAAFNEQIEKLSVRKPMLNFEELDSLLSQDWRTVYDKADKEIKRGFWQRLGIRIYIDGDKQVSFVFT